MQQNCEFLITTMKKDVSFHKSPETSLSRTRLSGKFQIETNWRCYAASLSDYIVTWSKFLRRLDQPISNFSPPNQFLYFSNINAQAQPQRTPLSFENTLPHKCAQSHMPRLPQQHYVCGPYLRLSFLLLRRKVGVFLNASSAASCQYVHASVHCGTDQSNK